MTEYYHTVTPAFGAPVWLGVAPGFPIGPDSTLFGAQPEQSDGEVSEQGGEVTYRPRTLPGRGVPATTGTAALWRAEYGARVIRWT